MTWQHHLVVQSSLEFEKIAWVTYPLEFRQGHELSVDHLTLVIEMAWVDQKSRAMLSALQIEW